MTTKISYDGIGRLFSISPDTRGGRTVDSSTDWAFNFTDRISLIEPHILEMLVTWVFGDEDYQYEVVKKLIKEYDRGIDEERVVSDISDSCDSILVLNNPLPPNKMKFKNPEFNSLYGRMVDYYNTLRKKKIKGSDLEPEAGIRIEGLDYCLTSLMGERGDTIVYKKGDDIVLVIVSVRSFIRSLFKVSS